ncbi:magnesium transporter [Sphingomonas ginkgonis]|uniref:Magnesium transport protein CorA n=1 Tax=Sphingomonas ginkgonis TaxID=2315330 RepID=A0A429V7V6_9SPHN|nr:magnesium transporter CorA family protein [Sphingomonas ginkgonis]RST30025.1 magnesium transporter [Sphingomonas ginkgonis]
MLRSYGPGCDGGVIKAEQGVHIPDHATWIDLEEPTREEEQLVERCVGVEVPTRDEMAEIEPSSRLYEKKGALYLTLSTLFGVDEGHPTAEPITFVLTRDRLVTVRYATPKPIRSFSDHVFREPELARTALGTLTNLLDVIIERLADEIENVGGEYETISDRIFRSDVATSRRIPTDKLQVLILRVGRAQSLLARIRETAVSTARLLSFLGASARLHEKGEEGALDHVRSLAADVSSLVDHSTFLSGNITFLLDAALGLIGIEQNAAMKLFSWAAVVFLPPTLIAGIYGMNFEHIPELKWLYGYPWALGLMLLSGIGPYFYFRRRGWI